MPKFVSNGFEWRVSSAKIVSTSCNVVIARALISLRFPIGVATMYNIPFLLDAVLVIVYALAFLTYQIE